LPWGKSHPLFPNPGFKPLGGAEKKSIWLSLCEAKKSQKLAQKCEKSAVSGEFSDSIPFMVRFYEIAQTYFATQ
jgi:hypothetical protein